MDTPCSNLKPYSFFQTVRHVCKQTMTPLTRHKVVITYFKLRGKSVKGGFYLINFINDNNLIVCEQAQHNYSLEL